jgi:hypothetical protein
LYALGIAFREAAQLKKHHNRDRIADSRQIRARLAFVPVNALKPIVRQSATGIVFNLKSSG